MAVDQLEHVIGDPDFFPPGAESRASYQRLGSRQL
jgi:hypothetical protein